MAAGENDLRWGSLSLKCMVNVIKNPQLFSAGEQHGSYVCMTAFRKHRHRTYLLWSSGALTLYELWPSVVLVVFYIFISGRKA